MWKIALDNAGAVIGFYPPDYQGSYPREDTLVEATEEEKERVYRLMPAYYDTNNHTFKRLMPPEPTLDELKAQKKAEIASARYEREIAGVEVNGITIDTGRDSQALITGAAVAAVLDDDYSLNWKTEAGFVHLTAPEIIAVAQAVRAHVQACFDREAELCALVDAAETKEELDEIIISWPV